MTVKTCVLSFTNPYSGKKDGGKIDVGNRIKALSLMDTSIDLYTKTKENDEVRPLPKDVKINKVYTSNQSNKLAYFLGKLPLSVQNKYSKEFSEILKESHYDLAIFEGEHMFEYAIKNDVRGKRKFIRMHDIESLYREELSYSTDNKLISILQKRDSKKYKNLEDKIVDYFDRFLFISKSELDKFSEMYPLGKEKFIWVPPAVPYKDDINYTQAKRNRILYFGDLSVPHNIKGIQWFLEKVYEKLIELSPETHIDIIGNVSDEFKNMLSTYSNVTAHGYVDDLNSFIDEASCIICPINHGAGVKIKLVESLGMGKIVIATPKAVEGTDFENLNELIIAEDPIEFSRYCAEVSRNHEKYHYLATNALKSIKNKYSLEAQGKLIINLYKEIEGND